MLVAKLTHWCAVPAKRPEACGLFLKFKSGASPPPSVEAPCARRDTPPVLDGRSPVAVGDRVRLVFRGLGVKPAASDGFPRIDLERGALGRFVSPLMLGLDLVPEANDERPGV